MSISTDETALAVNEAFGRPDVDAMVLGNLSTPTTSRPTSVLAHSQRCGAATRPDVEEFDEIKQHAVFGRPLLSGVSTALFSLAAEAAWSHHEWRHGSGSQFDPELVEAFVTVLVARYTDLATDTDLDTDLDTDGA